MAEMPFAKHNDMVKTAPSDRTDEPLRISILPWRPYRDRTISYAHCSKTHDDDIAIDAIPVANDISGVCGSRKRRSVDRKSTGHWGARSHPVTEAHGGESSKIDNP